MEEHQHQTEELEKLQNAEIDATFHLAHIAAEYVFAHLDRLVEEAAGCPGANDLVHAANAFDQAIGRLVDAEELARFDAIVQDVELEDDGEDAAAAEEIDARHARRLREIEDRQS